MKYIYRVEPIKIGMLPVGDDSKKQEKQLSANGEDGWELVCVSEGAKYLKYVYCKEVSDEEYDEEVQKAEVKVEKKPKKVLSPEQLKKINMIWMIAFGVLALTAIVLAIVNIAVASQLAELETEYWSLYEGGQYAQEYTLDVLDPGYVMGLVILAVGLAFGGLAFWRKKQWMWIVASVLMAAALFMFAISVYADACSVSSFKEDIALLKAATP